MVYSQKTAFQDDFMFTVRAQTGSRFCGRTSDFHGYPFGVHGFYDWRNWALATALCVRGDTIVEVGANVGTETVGFRDIVGAEGKVFAIEPVPSNLDALNDLVKLDRWTNVHILPIALGDIENRVTFALPPHKHASGVGHIVRNAALATSRTIEVACARFDSLEDKVGRARAIFCDTEGAETMVLRGAHGYIRKYKPAIVLESSPKLLSRAGSSVGDLYQTIRDAGYLAFVVRRFDVTPVSSLAGTSACNWLCLHESESAIAKRCSRAILTCAVLPCIRGVNPLCC
jgi:FkbM family methyltransferase